MQLSFIYFSLKESYEVSLKNNCHPLKQIPPAEYYKWTEWLPERTHISQRRLEFSR